MSIMNPRQFAGKLKSISTNAATFRADVQEALISASYYAFKDGDSGPLNRVLDAVGEGTRKKGITMWVELVAGICRVKEGKFVLNKKIRDQSGVINEATFAEFEEELRKVAWWEVAGKEKVASVFDTDKYMDSVLKKLEKEGQASLASDLRDALIAYHVKLNGSVTDPEPEIKLAA